MRAGKPSKLSVATLNTEDNVTKKQQEWINKIARNSDNRIKE